MNLKELATNLELEEEELLKLIHLFLETTSSELVTFQSALENRDFPVAERMAHSIKGAAGILGLTEIHDAALTIERAVRDNCLADINRCLPMIRANLDLMTECLKTGKLKC